jgi:hypothetical protein
MFSYGEQMGRIQKEKNGSFGGSLLGQEYQRRSDYYTLNEYSKKD